MTQVQATVAAVTDRIIERSTPTRTAYLARMHAVRSQGPRRGSLACGNLAHGFASAPPEAKAELRQLVKPNIAIVTSYNDMLSAHAPFATYPDVIKRAVLRAGGIAQVAGGVPAMCDGITQGRAGMELSLLSRDVIAMSTAIGLAHDMFDGALMLGVCDKIVPGMLIGALSFGHLPTAFVPAGPMTSGLPNNEKSRVRQEYAEGKVGREELLEAEAASYHSQGTCTFYGTANSNQMLMEIMGLHLPGSTFINPGTPLREALTVHTASTVTHLAQEARAPLAEIVSERTIVNACVGLLATGGSTNHTLHLVAIARAAGIHLTWDDLSELSRVVPLIARVYPNGTADVNHFAAAGGMQVVIGTLLAAGLLHEDVETVMGHGLSRYLSEPRLVDGELTWLDGPKASLDPAVLRDPSDPFDAEGGLKVVRGPLGTGVVKVSAVSADRRSVTAPAVVFEDQDDLLAAFQAGTLVGDFVAVIRHQGPAANGMPELHKLTPALNVLQKRGQQVALVTDGRMSGASGSVLAAIHVTPEAAVGGPLAQVRDGDLITVDATTGELSVDADLSTRTPQAPPASSLGTGRELFDRVRSLIGPADHGASILGSTR